MDFKSESVAVASLTLSKKPTIGHGKHTHNSATTYKKCLMSGNVATDTKFVKP